MSRTSSFTQLTGFSYHLEYCDRNEGRGRFERNEQVYPQICPRRAGIMSLSELLSGGLLRLDRDNCEQTDAEMRLAWSSNDKYEHSDDVWRSELWVVS